MAKLMLIGPAAQVEILTDPEDEELILAKCVKHTVGYGPVGQHCTWAEQYDTTDDAVVYASDHADGPR
jgi:hypothetical protein